MLVYLDETQAIIVKQILTGLVAANVNTDYVNDIIKQINTGLKNYAK